MTAIEWTDATWNPIVGCSRVSAGCEHCYAERTAHRGMAPQHRGLTVLGKHGPRWTGEVRLVEERLALPLRWRKPRRVFVNSMSDLFHEALPIPTIARVFAVMAQASGHTFQVLTKRPTRMREVLSSELFWSDADDAWCELFGEPGSERTHDFVANEFAMKRLPNVWLGVTAEDQAAADERIPLLLDTPAAVRFVSYEPALGPVDFRRWLRRCGCGGLCDRGPCPMASHATLLDWLIVGGESGPKARPFDLAWARSAIAQCKAAGVPVFFKQAGARPTENGEPLRLRDRSGGDMSEWPSDLRVREFPERSPR